MKVVVVVPCHNEESHISSVISGAAKHADAIVVVDDGSTDDTSLRVLESAQKNVTLLRNIMNLGKGAAARTGCDYAIESLDADAVILVDGDGQHDPEDIPRFRESAEKGAEIVYGMRKRSKQMPRMMALGNWFLTGASNVLLRLRLYDTQCGYRLLTRRAYFNVRWQTNDYGMESEMIARAAARKLKHEEILIKTVYIDRYKGTTPLDGVRIFVNLLKWRMFVW